MRTRIVLLVPFLVVGCFTGDAAEADVASLRAEVSSLQTRLESTYHIADSLRIALRRREFFESLGRAVVLDPTVDRFSVLESDYGTLTFTVTAVDPIADGSRVTLQVGNLSGAMIAGGTLSAQWGPRQGEAEDYALWQAKLRQEDIHFTEALAPGVWNRVRLNLGGIPPAGLGYLRISIKELPTIRMRSP